MNTHADKASETKSTSMANGSPKRQPNGRVAVPLADNRPEATALMKMQELANDSPHASRLRALQQLANNSQQVSQLRSLQQLANNSPQARQASQFQVLADVTSPLPIQQKISNGIAQLAQETEEEELIQAKPQTGQRQPSATDGRPRPNNTGLPDNLKSGIEALSGLSLDHVKVHYNSAQPAQLNALAYAQGSDIHLAPGQEQHLPHEAWHIVQQAQGRVKPTMQMKDGVPVNDDAGLEREADLMGAKAYAIGERSPNSDVASDGSATPLAETVRTKIEHAFAGAFSALGRLDRTMSLASRAATHTEPTATLGSQVPKMGVPYQIRNHPTQHIDQTHPGTAMPLQRARLNVRKNGTISGVSDWPKRPTSNLRGTQGQHLTAYVAFEDAILSHVKDVTVPEAADALRALLSEILNLPGMSIQSGAYLMKPIENNMEILRMNADNPVVVGEVIDNILIIRNKIPGTAAQGTGGGHGEAKSSGTLETLETALRRDSWDKTWDEDIVENQCRSFMWGLLDYNPAQPADDKAAKVIGDRVLTHFLSLRMAYPKTFEWLTEREAYLFTYLEANRDSAGMPLKELTQLQFYSLRDYVHSKLG
jgi:hypothetical protein